MNERDKMLAGQLYDPFDTELVQGRNRARDLCQDLNATREADQAERRRILRELFGAGGESVWMQPPFFCDYGTNIELGERVFFNFNCVVLDVCRVRIGSFTLFGPAVQIYTPMHPFNAELRRSQEFGKPIDIGSDVRVGGGAIILPGVRIGSKAVIGAGSVVTRDIPEHVFAAGNPCRVIREDHRVASRILSRKTRESVWAIRATRDDAAAGRAVPKVERGRCARWLCIGVAITAWGAATGASAWIYPEHRDIAVLAVQGLDAERRTVFDRLWQDARIGDEARLCASGADAQQGLTPTCIDWAALSAIAGDHSCSGADLIEAVRRSDWILVVADVAAQLKEDLARIPVTATPEQSGGVATAVGDARRRIADQTSRAKRVNALRTADIRLQRADPQYATRADSNLAHFLLPRPDTDLDPFKYSVLALRSGSVLNAVGVYSWYHLSALQKASRLANEQLSADERRALARAALIDEAFALHFLEDMYAAGHVAGSWGDVSQRKGTHDHYNQNGLEVFTWRGRDRTIVLMGDAHMRPEDAALAAEAVRRSLAQVLDVASGRAREYTVPHTPTAPARAEDFDICKADTFPDREERFGAGLATYRPALVEVLAETPVAGLGPGLGSQPRARSELGVFMGLAASIEGRSVSAGFEASQNSPGFVPGLDVAFRMGFGLEGALGDASDGLVFAQLGLHTDGASTNKFSQTGLGTIDGSLTAAIPARSGLSVRIRMPYYLIPGDLLFLSPMYLADRQKYTQLAVAAANGGLLGLQQGYATPIGRFQFVLGRELGITWYGLLNDDQLLAPSDPPGGIGRIVNFKSTYFDLPILEYRPYRAFAANQSSSLLFQLFAGADVPDGASVAGPLGAPTPKLRTVWSIGLRMVFDWRYYR